MSTTPAKRPSSAASPPDLQPKNPGQGGQASGRSVGDEAILKVTKEIVVKFIEVGRLSPANFNEIFAEIYQTVRNAVRP